MNINISDGKNIKKELWEIQGCLYIIASNPVAYRWELLGHIFFWYGIVTIIFGIFSIRLIGKSKD